MSLDIDNPFWRFSLRVYAAPGVAEECLEVQDKLGIDVNVMLYAAWLGATRGIALEQADMQHIDAAVAAWSSGVVQPLREVRRKLKRLPEISDRNVQSLRKQVANVELFSEQLEQAMLYRLADDIGRPAGERNLAARRNVSMILALRGADADIFPLHKLLASADAARDE